jgi:hypothetical protein
MAQSLDKFIRFNRNLLAVDGSLAAIKLSKMSLIVVSVTKYKVNSTATYTTVKSYQSQHL